MRSALCIGPYVVCPVYVHKCMIHSYLLVLFTGQTTHPQGRPYMHPFVVQTSFAPTHKTDLICTHINTRTYMHSNMEQTSLAPRWTSYGPIHSADLICAHLQGTPHMHPHRGQTYDICTHPHQTLYAPTHGADFIGIRADLSYGRVHIRSALYRGKNEVCEWAHISSALCMDVNEVCSVGGCI